MSSPESPRIVPQPGRVGQGTAVEQSRAAAEVLGAIEAARRWPRDEQLARRELEISCGLMSVADGAFYDYRRAGERVHGLTVSIAREMARCWQHVHHGIVELRRDEEYGQSEVMCFAWDVQMATRATRTFILPHRRYNPKRGSDNPRMIDLRDIQENNASVGGRAVRDCIFGVLPPWLRAETETMCRQTLLEGERNKDGTRKQLPPLPIRRGNAIDSYDKLGVTERQLVQRLDKPTDHWTPHDLLMLGNVLSSIQRGETTAEAEFPRATASGAEVLAQTPVTSAQSQGEGNG